MIIDKRSMKTNIFCSVFSLENKLLIGKKNILIKIQIIINYALLYFFENSLVPKEPPTPEIESILILYIVKSLR